MLTMTDKRVSLKNCIQIGTIRRRPMSKNEYVKSTTMIERMAKQISHLEVQNVNSGVLQQFSLFSPYMILSETSNEKNDIYNVYQISPVNSAFVQYDSEQQKQLISRPQHKHSFIEIMYVLSGAVTNRIEDQSCTYTKGQCCVMNRNICHCEVFEGDFQAAFFMFRDDFLQTLLDEYREELKLTSDSITNQPLFQLFHDALTGAHHFDKIYLDCLPVVPAEEALEQMIPVFNEIIMETAEKKAGFSACVKGYFTRFFHLLSSPELYSVEQIHSEADRHEYLTTKIIHILEANHGRCSREQLAKQLGYTGEYLNRIFKKYTGKTISEYRQFIFLKEAKYLLSDTDMSISEIISELGFSNRNYFYQLFRKEFGLTPLEYRKRHKIE